MEERISDIDILIKKAMYYKDSDERNLELALKYAMTAAAATFTPRADVCCVIGEIYLERNVMEWAEIWYSKAYQNRSTYFDEILPPEQFMTVIPLTKLTYIASVRGEYEKSLAYANSVLAIDPENEIALDNKSRLEKKLQEIKEKTE